MQLFQSSSHARLVAAVTPIPILPLPAGAEAGPQYWIGANAGLVMPLSDLGNFTSSGYQVAVTLGMHQPLTPLSFHAEGSFTELPWSDNTGNSGAKHRISGIAVDGQYNLGTPSTNGGLYITGRVGYHGSNDVHTSLRH